MLALKLSPPVTDSRGFLPEIKHNSPRPWSHFVRNRHAQSRFRMMSSSSLNVVLVNKLETLQPQTLNLNTNFKKPKHKLQKRKLQALGVLALPRALDPETSIQDLLAVYSSPKKQAGFRGPSPTEIHGFSFMLMGRRL